MGWQSTPVMDREFSLCYCVPQSHVLLNFSLVCLLRIFKWICNIVVGACSEVLSQYFYGGIRETMDIQLGIKCLGKFSSLGRSKWEGIILSTTFGAIDWSERETSYSHPSNDQIWSQWTLINTSALRFYVEVLGFRDIGEVKTQFGFWRHSKVTWPLTVGYCY